LSQDRAQIYTETAKMKHVSHLSRLYFVALLISLTACAAESHRSVAVEKPVTAAAQYSGPKSALIVGKFDNRSSYLRGMFSDGVDRVGGQAKTILIGHLQETGRFDVLDRDNRFKVRTLRLPAT
jgi:curli biogenesis system outer membrane secretion channel CsgG